jgi:hypothetical protein
MMLLSPHVCSPGEFNSVDPLHQRREDRLHLDAGGPCLAQACVPGLKSS